MRIAGFCPGPSSLSIPCLHLGCQDMWPLVSKPGRREPKMPRGTGQQTVEETVTSHRLREALRTRSSQGLKRFQMERSISRSLGLSSAEGLAGISYWMAGGGCRIKSLRSKMSRCLPPFKHTFTPKLSPVLQNLVCIRGFGARAGVRAKAGIKATTKARARVRAKA